MGQSSLDRWQDLMAAWDLAEARLRAEGEAAEEMRSSTEQELAALRVEIGSFVYECRRKRPVRGPDFNLGLLRS